MVHSAVNIQPEGSFDRNSSLVGMDATHQNDDIEIDGTADVMASLASVVHSADGEHPFPSTEQSPHAKPHGKSAPVQKNPQKDRIPPKRSRKWRRKSSGGFGASTSRKATPLQRVTVLDDAPCRLVNPLTTWQSAYDLIALQDIWFPRPDTYSIAYHMRLLGFGVPKATAEARGIPKQLTLQRDESYRHVPEPSLFASMIWKNGRLHPHSVTEDVDDCRLLHELDPLYVALLQAVGNQQVLNVIAPTATQYARLEQMASREKLQPLWESARAHGIVSAEWKFETLFEYRTTHPQHNIRLNTMAIFLYQGDTAQALVAYDFVWFQVDGTTSELIVHIRDIRNSTDSFLDPATAPNEILIILTISLALQHAKAAAIWYARLEAPTQLAQMLTYYFRATKVAERPDGRVEFVFDLHKCSYELAFLRYKKNLSYETAAENTRHCWLARFPSVEDVERSLQGTQRTIPVRKFSPYFTAAPSYMRDISLHVRAQFKDDSLSTLERVQDDGTVVDLEVPSFQSEPPSIQFFRDFDVPSVEEISETDEILEQLVASQAQVEALEEAMEPVLQRLLEKVITERIEYESPKVTELRRDEARVLEENRKMLERRKQLDEAWQKQLEQDMDAVCDICNDGEVAPDNQILFCESCNVAVHQICYGIERIPEGDYYCIPCRYLGRNKVVAASPSAPKKAPEPLPICCELCPLRKGAFVQTEMPNAGKNGKWVHVVCAKWQGLNFVDPGNLDLVEDVSELKKMFLQLGITCDLCLGKRGAMIQCRFHSCEKWLHVTCARLSGLCEVVHGENIHGPVAENPWSLLCPVHSLKKATSKECISVDRLIEAAKTFPKEPEPEPLPVQRKPFNNADGQERRALMADPGYDRELLVELTQKRMQGVRCEVCDDSEENGTNLIKCKNCGVVICVSCKLESDDRDGPFKCPACSFKSSQRSSTGEDLLSLQCLACYQWDGMLRPAFAKPMKMTQWSKKPEEYKRSLFGRQLWVHSLCAFWNPKLILSIQTGKVNCSNVVMGNGKTLIAANVVCALCGNSGGLKLPCQHDGCQVSCAGEGVRTHFHVTCARQAGLEVNAVDTKEGTIFYVKCYLHSGNAYNLRARLEDLIEVEKRRSGKTFAKVDAPMTFSHASRLLNSALQVMRMLGWAWRWAEWWVDYNSSWEPLLEEGEKEENMTKEELKIIDSTRESRCKDARICRLAPFGAALRDRKYDVDDEFDRKSLERALRAILHTKSLVGPLDSYEMDFFVEWLSAAYRSKSRLLGYGEDKIPVSGDSFCKHLEDGSPKYELGDRPLPGKQEQYGRKIYETGINEPDDFLKTYVFNCPPQKPNGEVEHEADPKPLAPAARKRKSKDNAPSPYDATMSPTKRGRGRPPTNKTSPKSKLGATYSAMGKASQYSTSTLTTSAKRHGELSNTRELVKGTRLGSFMKHSGRTTGKTTAESTSRSIKQEFSESNLPKRRGRPTKIHNEPTSTSMLVSPILSKKRKMVDEYTAKSRTSFTHSSVVERSTDFPVTRRIHRRDGSFEAVEVSKRPNRQSNKYHNESNAADAGTEQNEIPDQPELIPPCIGTEASIENMEAGAFLPEQEMQHCVKTEQYKPGEGENEACAEKSEVPHHRADADMDGASPDDDLKITEMSAEIRDPSFSEEIDASPLNADVDKTETQPLDSERQSTLDQSNSIENSEHAPTIENSRETAQPILDTSKATDGLETNLVSPRRSRRHKQNAPKDDSSCIVPEQTSSKGLIPAQDTETKSEPEATVHTEMPSPPRATRKRRNAEVSPIAPGSFVNSYDMVKHRLRQPPRRLGEMVEKHDEQCIPEDVPISVLVGKKPKPYKPGKSENLILNRDARSNEGRTRGKKLAVQLLFGTES